MNGSAKKTSCVCLLRGINVAGHGIVRMEALRAAFASLGLEEVRTYVQSGNVVFRTRLAPDALARRIEKKLLDAFGTKADATVLTAEELRRVVAGNPFAKESRIDPAKLHVTFLATAPDRERLKKLEALPAGRDEYRRTGTLVYLHCPDGYGRSKLANNAIERALATRATTRNWRTVTTLAEMAAE